MFVHSADRLITGDKLFRMQVELDQKTGALLSRFLGHKITQKELLLRQLRQSLDLNQLNPATQ